MKSLEKLNDELLDVEKTAALNPEELPPQTRGAWTVAVRDARDRLAALRAEYRTTLLRNSVAIFLNGDQVKVAEVVSLATEEGGIVVDASALYRRLATEVERTLSDQRSWGIHQTHKLHLVLQEVMHEVGLTQMSMPSRQEMPLVPTFEDTVNHIRNIVRGAEGDDLNTIYVREQVAKRALEIRYIGVLAPVLIVGAQADEQQALARIFGKGGDVKVTVNSDDEINKEYLAKTLKRIRKK